MRHILAELDFETSEKAGAGGMFQVVALTENGKDVTDLVDQGTHYSSLKELKSQLEKQLNEDITIETHPD